MMDKYKIKNGKKYFNWSVVGQLLVDMETKAQKIFTKQRKFSCIWC